MVELTPSRGLAALLRRKVKFVVSKKPDKAYEALKAKYKAVNGQPPKRTDQPKTGAVEPQEPPQKEQTPKGIDRLYERADGLPVPQQTLFDARKLALEWRAVRGVGSGMVNMGSTCYLNSVLQCLVHTPGLAEYCVQGEHGRRCRARGTFCALCELEATVKASQTQRRPFLPGIARQVKQVAKHFRTHRQEDAHEFYIYLMDALQRACLAGLSPQLEHATKETTLVYALFGGFLRSRIRCSACRHVSNTYDPTLDLSLDIRHCDTLEKALARFHAPELLHRDNQYHCSKCGKPQDATKQVSLHQAPLALVIQLKRFAFDGSGEKVRGHVQFPLTLPVAPYQSASERRRNMVYDLYGVVVHHGRTCRSGHYSAFVKAANGVWYMVDDDEVRQVGVNAVLKQSAYLLFYRVIPDSGAAKARHASVSSGLSTVPLGQEGVALGAALETFMGSKNVVAAKRPPKPTAEGKRPPPVATPGAKEAMQTDALAAVTTRLYAHPVDQWEAPETPKDAVDERIAATERERLAAQRQRFIADGRLDVHRRSKYDREYDVGKVKVTKRDRELRRQQGDGRSAKRFKFQPREPRRGA